MLDFFASIFGYLMNFIYSIVQNYGVAIIIFTVLVKLLLLPFTIKQQKSLESAQEMQPIIQELQRKYGNNQQKFAEEYQKLLKEKNVSVMSSMGCSGCLLSLIQLPILLAMFYMMVSPLTHIMKLDEEVIENYKEEINLARKTQAIEQIESNRDSYTEKEFNEMIEAANNKSYVDARYYEIDIIKEKDLLDMNFFGINLCDIAINNKSNKLLIIIPILSTLFTYLSLYITSQINKKKEQPKPKLDDMEVPMPDMKLMNIMMPIMMGYVAYSVPQGVGLYWATSNMLGVIQTIAMRKIFKKDEKNDTLNNVKYRVEEDIKNDDVNKSVSIDEKSAVKTTKIDENNVIQEKKSSNSNVIKNKNNQKSKNKKKKRK